MTASSEKLVPHPVPARRDGHRGDEASDVRTAVSVGVRLWHESYPV
jgi:hypothetical protein